MSRGGPARLVHCGTLLLVLLVAVAAPGGGVTESSSGAATQISADTVLMDVALREDGDARWAIRYRVRLDDENATAAFESIEEDVRENRSAYANRFERRLRGTVSAAENATGREMAVENVSVRTTRQEIPQQYGLLVYTFEWRGFAEVDGAEIRAGDAISGLYLDSSTSLTVGWPTGYTVVATDPAPDETGDRSVTWRGPDEFTGDQPRVVVRPAAASPTPGDGGVGTDGGTASAGFPAAAIAGAAVAVAGFLVAVWWRRRGGTDVLADDAGTGGSGGDPPEELLSNEERVLGLLEEHGGRMKQQQVVEELGWTDAKTSQVVGDLRESGEIEGFRLGRENVLNLPEGDGGEE